MAKLPAPIPAQIIAVATTVVGVGPGGSTSMLAYGVDFLLSFAPLTISAPRTCRRVAVVDYRGQMLLDKYVAPTMAVSDYRSATTGIEEGHLGGCLGLGCLCIDLRQQFSRCRSFPGGAGTSCSPHERKGGRGSFYMA